MRGFQFIEVVAEDERFQLDRAIHELTQQHVIIKKPKQNYMSASVIEELKSEAQQLQAASDIQVMPMLEFLMVEDQPVIIFVDNGGQTVQQLLKTTREKMPLQIICSVAIAIVTCIEQLHAKKLVLIHASPTLFYINEQHTKAYLTDIRQVKTIEAIANENSEVIHLYTAPEIVRRATNINYYQADVYAVGVLLYEWFAKVAPYTNEHTPDLTYHHLATMQSSVAKVNPSVPVILSAIIDKCMAKNPEQRYKSMMGLRVDLEECLTQMQTTASVQPFILGCHEQQEHKNTFLDYVQTPTIALLKKAAIVGERFYFETLQQLSDLAEPDIRQYLSEAVKHQLLSVVNYGGYAFQSTATQQFFYQLVPQAEQQVLHFQIGEIFVEQMQWDTRISNLDVLAQWQGLDDYIVTKGKRKLLLSCYISVTEQVLKKQQIAAAAGYLQQAWRLFQDKMWNQHERLAFSLYQVATELAISQKDYAHAEELIQTLLAKAHSFKQTEALYLQLLHIYLVSNRYEEVYETGLYVLGAINCPIKLKQNNLLITIRWIKLQRKLGSSPDETIQGLPAMKNEQIQIAVKVLVYMANATFFSDRTAWFPIVLQIIELTIEYGLAEGSAYGFAAYGLIKSFLFKQYEASYRYCRFAITLVSKETAIFMQVNTLYLLCQESWRKYDPYFLLVFMEDIHESNLFYDEEWYINYNFLLSCAQLFQFSYPLGEIHLHLTGRYVRHLEQGQVHLRFPNTSLANMIATLTGNEITDSKRGEFVEKPLSDKLIEDSFINGLQYLTIYIPQYLFEEFEEALAVIEESLLAEKYRVSQKVDDVIILSHCYYYVLVAKELFHKMEEVKQRAMLKQIKQFKKRFKKLAAKSPENFLHKYYFTQAIYYHVTQRLQEAQGFYEKAFSIAQQYEHTHDTAMIAEAIANYYMQLAKPVLVKVYLNEAYEAFQKWGASAKAAQLVSKYPDVLMVKNTTDLIRKDYMTTVNYVQTLTEETDVEALVKKLMYILLQNAGAEYGALVLNMDGAWQVEAYGKMENLTVRSMDLERMDEYIPAAIIEYTAKTRKEVVLQNATTSIFSRHAYIQKNKIKSVLSLPIIVQNRLIGVFYMENNLSTNVFTEEKLDVLKLLCVQCAMTLLNARLSNEVQFLQGNLKQLVDERTDTLQKSVQATSEALAEMTVYAERNRIAQEIHDIVGHTLTSTILQIEAGRRLLPKDLESATIRLKEAQDLVRHSLKEIRNSVHMLKEDQYYSADDMLQQLIQDTMHNTDVMIYTQLESVASLPLIMKKLIYHALQEGLTNGIRHGQSTVFYVDLNNNGEVVTFKLVDNGQGAEPLILGFGLKMMQERVKQLKGTFLITSERGNGTTIEMKIPYSL